MTARRMSESFVSLSNTIQRASHPDLKSFCIFIGYPRSGHSLIGALLDAHPNITISHEANILSLVKEGRQATDIFETILDNSRRHALIGRQETGYSYEVPGQWQGRTRELMVIGDKKGGRTSLMLHEEPSLLDKLIATLNGLPLKILHVTRNPFDIIATMFRRRQPPLLDDAIDLYITMSIAVAETKTRIGPDVILDIRHENVIADTASELRRMCAFLEVTVDPEYLQSCSGIVYRAPNKSRHSIEWSDAQLNKVMKLINAFPFLERYAIDD